MKNNRAIRWYEPSKYHNRKVIIDGIEFDSEKEGKRYNELKVLAKAGEISDLRLQVKYELIPAQYEMKDEWVSPTRVQQKEVCVERAVNYIADFVYRDTMTEETVVEDVKGMRTEVFRLKKKLMRWRYGIEIKEV